MKKTYMTPEAEKIQFNYRDQVVAASGDGENNGLFTNSMTDMSCYNFEAIGIGIPVCY